MFMFQRLKEFIVRCLTNTDDLHLSSIAFPLMGTGRLGYTVKQVARAMFGGISKFLQLCQGTLVIKDIKIVIPDASGDTQVI